MEEAKKTPKDQEDDIVYGVALAEIIEYIKECAFGVGDVPVFKLSDLRDFFSKRLCEYGASTDSITRGHSTRLKQNILKNILRLCEHKQERGILLIFEETAGDAILHACVRSGESDGFCLAKAANIIRKQLFVDQQDPESAL